MDRLISEEKVLEAFREYQGSISDFYKAVKAIPSAEQKIVPIAEIHFDEDKMREICKEVAENIEVKQDWIPVSERLPEEQGIYLAYIINEHDNKLQYPMTAYFSPNKVGGSPQWFPDDETASDNVIAWMPIEPYKGEQE